MGLYLVEVDIDVSTPEKRAAIMERIEEVITNKGKGGQAGGGSFWVAQPADGLFCL